MRLAILGAGPGGYVAAIKAAQSGAQVIIIEADEVGGVCLNWGCIPTKALVASSRMLSRARRAEDFGIDINGEPMPNFSKILERENKIVRTQIKGIRNLLKSRGITLKEGRGRLISPKEVRVTLKDGSQEIVETDKVIIATGSRPSRIPVFPFDGKRVISTDDVFRLNGIPKSLLIAGAGVSGCEFACIFREFGSEVTLIEMLPRVLATEDIEISELLERELKKKKIRLLTQIKAEKMDMLDDGVRITLTDGQETTVEKVLVTAGREFNSEGIGTEEIGITRGQRGEIVVNEKMETNVSGVYAIGDVIGGLLLAHVASREGIVAVRNIMGGDERMDYSVVPSAIFTSPEIASVGLREHQAAEKGIRFRTGRFQFKALGKAHLIGEIEGMIKIISDEESDRILGVHIIGPHASDLIHEAVLAMKKGLTARDISETIHAHPTLSEVLMEAAEDVHGEAIHAPKQ
jgi:dihydrolipoamide dehydrogenase